MDNLRKGLVSSQAIGTWGCKQAPFFCVPKIVQHRNASGISDADNFALCNVFTTGKNHTSVLVACPTLNCLGNNLQSALGTLEAP